MTPVQAVSEISRACTEEKDVDIQECIVCGDFFDASSKSKHALELRFERVHFCQRCLATAERRAPIWEILIESTLGGVNGGRFSFDGSSGLRAWRNWI